MIASAQLDDLRALLQSDQFSERDGRPMLSPWTTEEIAAITRFADENSLAIEIFGGGTKRGWGNAVAADLLLDTTRLNRVIEHPWQDLTCTVQAGCTWSAMEEVLGQHKQFVALDPLWPDRATVGGIVATNDSGALRHRYGSLRDLVIGMTIVLADGTIAKSGGKVVKNVAGYDLHKLMTGAYGTLGVIAEVTFRLHPLPLHAQTFTVSAQHAAQLAPLMAAIRNSHLLTQALQLRGDSHNFHLDIQLNAHPDAKHDEILQTLINSAGLELERVGDEVWKVRESVFSSSEENLLLKLTTASEDVSQRASDFLYLGGYVVIQSLGIGFASLPLAVDLDGTSQRLDSLCVSADCAGGSLLIADGPIDITQRLRQHKQKLFPDISSRGGALMRSIKHQFDPNRILNPGRFLGGI